MKKVFLLLTSAMFGVAAMAQTSWGDITSISEVTGEISLPYNQYGPDNDGDGKADQFQKGNSLLTDAVFEDSGNAAWVPALNEDFTISLTATPNFSGKLQFSIACEEAEVDYWAEMSGYGIIENVEAGVEFTKELTLTINAIEKAGVPLSVAHLVMACFPEPSSADESFTTEPKIINFKSFELHYSAALDIEKPFSLTCDGPADKPEDGFKYMVQEKTTEYTGVKEGAFVNVEFTGVAMQDIATMMFGLANQDESGSKWELMCEMGTFAANIKKDQKLDTKFSLKLDKNPVEGVFTYINYFMAQDPEKVAKLYFKESTVKVTVSADQKYPFPVVTALDEVAAADFAIEGGMVYSAGVITVYNVAGQVVATASQEFNVNTLAAGAYFIVAEEGTIKFVK